jgi:sugar (pentulose or hexulose) kinase
MESYPNIIMQSSKIKQYIAGIDIGTTNIKGSVYDGQGNFIESYSYSYESYSPEENFHEQNPLDWVRLLKRILKDICTKKSIKEGLRAISFSTQGGTLVMLDKECKNIGNAITWLDRRGYALYASSKYLQKRNIDCYLKTGWRLDSCMGLMPVYWVRKKHPELFSKIHKVMFVNDFLLYRFCGNAIMDPSNASISMFYNVVKGQWDTDLLKMAGLSKDYFSPVREFRGSRRMPKRIRQERNRDPKRCPARKWRT